VYPAIPLRPIRVINVDAAYLAAKPGDDLVRAVAIQVRSEDGVALVQRVVDHLPLPFALLVLAVNRNQVSVPRLDRRQKPRLRGLASKPPYRDVARSRLRPGRRIPLGQLGSRPCAVRAETKQIEANEARRQNVVAARAVPIRDVDSVRDAFVL